MENLSPSITSFASVAAPPLPSIAVGSVFAQQTAAILAGFAGPKVWYDLSDLTTLFQDSAGTTPVTALGQPIGRILDKSGAGNLAVQVTAGSRPLWQRSFAAFDGVDDSWSTATIDFTSTDKVTVIAGVRKLSDAADGTIQEFGPSNAVSGMFYLRAPGSGASTKFEFLSRGTSMAVPFTSSATFSAPISVVATGIGDIGTPSATLRLNGAVISTIITSQGTGPYGNYPLYIGRRNETSVPFNGNIYGLIIIGRLLTATELSTMERYMAAQTGVVL